jgi:glycosyltransferase involved in cell wall biosynthesis
MPRVSALIPTYERAAYVGGAIETVLAQSYADIEAVVVNDGSTDWTRDVLAEYAGHGRVQIHHNEENRGISSSFNRAAAEADGELLCILGDDDRWHPEKVEQQVRQMDSLPSEYGVVYTGGVATEEGRVVHVDRPTWEENIYPEIIAAWKLDPHSGHMLRREAFEAVGGFDTDFPRCVDREMCIRLAKEYRFAYLDELLVERLVHNTNISHEPEQADVNAMILEKYGAEIDARPEVASTLYARWHGMRARVACERGDRWEAAREYWAALTARPAAFRLVLLLLAVLGPAVFERASTLRRRLLDARLHATTDPFWDRTEK